MNYHIGTMLIEENFDDNYECPLCRIHKTIDNRLTEQYLGEGVMEDHTRAEVNELGFCSHHFSLLYSMPSKLGLALQASTRLKTIMDDFAAPQNAKQAKKRAEKILEHKKTCVICKYLDAHMVRYYKTVAEVYSSRPSFEQTIKGGKGFCAEHYAKLITYAPYAGTKSKDYLRVLAEVQNARIAELTQNLLKFCDRHDYRNAQKPLGDEKYALKDYEQTFYGSKD